MSVETTVAAVNAVLEARGHEERIVRGVGYYYFIGGGSAMWPTSGVYENRLIGTPESFADLRDEMAQERGRR